MGNKSRTRWHLTINLLWVVGFAFIIVGVITENVGLRLYPMNGAFALAMIIFLVFAVALIVLATVLSVILRIIPLFRGNKEPRPKQKSILTDW